MIKDQLLYKSDLYEAEHELAVYLSRYIKQKTTSVSWKIDGLLHKQPEAVIHACTKSLSILTGPPGTGKTTTLRSIVDSFVKSGLRGHICCPTGKAAKRADQVVNQGRNFVERIKCSTIHALLEYAPQEGGFRYNRLNKLRLDFLILDEFSMPEVILARDLFEALDHKKTRVVLCGDQYQLPSIGPGSFARDVINSGLIPTTELDVVLRTGENSGITYNANLILRGKDLSKNDSSGTLFKDFYFVPKQTEKQTLDSILKWVLEDLPKRRNLNPISDIQILCPGKNSLIGTKNMNEILRRELNKEVSTGNSNTIGGFRVGDKVINVTNSKQLNIVNGDVGFVKDVVKGESGKHLLIDFGGVSGPHNNGLVEITSEIADKQIRLAYTLTIHKSQGSEFPCVLIPIHKCHTILLTRNLFYTAVSRGKQLVTIAGDPEAVRHAIRNNITNQRKTMLSEYIKRYSKAG